MSSADINQKQRTGKSGILIVSILAIIIAWLLCGGRSYKETVKKFIDASLSADAKSMVALLPKDLVSYSIDSEGFDSKKDLIDDIQASASESRNIRNDTYGRGWDYDYEITDTYVYSDDEVDMYLYYYGDYYTQQIKSAMEVSVIVIIEETEKIDLTFTLLKIGRNWYVDNLM